VNVVRDLVALGVDVTVAELDDDRRARARLTGATRCVDAAEHLPECDGYVVVTQAPSHREVCELVLERGAPVFVEKPPCTDVADVEALASQGGDRLFVMHKWRYHPGIRALADLASSGRLGTIERLATTRTGPGTLPPDVDVLWHLGTHDLSIAVEILGGVAPIRNVEATHDSSGLITQCTVSMGQLPAAEHRMVVAAGVPAQVRRFVVTGSDASAVVEGADVSAISVHRRDGVETLTIPRTMPLTQELRAFLVHLGGGSPPVSDAATALTIARQLSEMQRVANGAAP